MRRYLSSGALQVVLMVLTPFVPAQDAWVHFSIRYWARQHGLNEECFLELGYRESSYNPYAVGPGGERGLFQFKRATWYWSQIAFGGPDSHDFYMAFNPWKNARMAALLLGEFDGEFDHWWKALPYCNCSIRKEDENGY